MAGSTCCLHSVNVFYILLSLGLTAGSIWFFVEVSQFTALRNSNHYLLDYNVYWPQAIPWMFIIVGLIAVCASICGFTGAKKKSTGTLTLYIVLQSVTVVLLIAAAIIALVFSDSKATADFIKDTVWDAYFQSKTETDVAHSFATIEKRLHCCGSDGPRDYKNWKNEFPMSCCDTYYHGWIGSYNIDCDFTNKLANERHGCLFVATTYASIAVKVLSSVALLTALVGLIGLVMASTMTKALKQKPRVIRQVESDSNKGLL